MVRGSYTKLKKKKEDRRGWITILIVALFFVAGSLIFINLEINKVDIIGDPNSKFYLCPKESPYGFTAILIDKTDPFNETQVLDIRRKILIERDKLEKHSLLTIFVIGHEKIKIEPIFSICNPGDGEDLENLDQKLAKSYYQDLYKQKFEFPLNEKLNVLSIIEKADTSPIMEMIQHVSISTFPITNTKYGNRLIIISDMIQNVTSFSMYSESYAYEDFKNLPYYKKIHTNLRDASIYILRSRQPGFERLQGEKLLKFWQKYFKDMGSSINITIDPVEG